MKIGISITSAYAGAEPRDGARRMIDRARAAWAAGLDSLFVGDHHVTPHPYYQNSPMLGRLLADWGDRPCGALYLLPLWHPVLLAELDLGAVSAVPRTPPRYTPIPRVPAETRDLAIVMTARATYEEVLAALTEIPAPAPAEF